MKRCLLLGTLLTLSVLFVAAPAAADPLRQRVPEVQWHQFYPVMGLNEAHAVAQTADGGFVYTADNVLVRTDAQGEILWSRLMFGSGYAVLPTPDDGYIVTGDTISDEVPGYHFASAGLMGRQPSLWVARYAADGELQWQRAWGGSGQDRGHAVAAAPGGGYIVAGQTSSLDGAAAGNHTRVVAAGLPGAGEILPMTSMWVLRLDAGGGLLWQRFLGSAANSLADAAARGLAAAPDGGFVVAGSIIVREGQRPGYLVRHKEEGGRRIATDSVYLVKLAATGAVQWERYLGGSMDDAAHAVRATADGGYIVAGFTNSDDGDVAGLTKGSNRFGSCDVNYWGRDYCRDNYHFDAWIAKLSSDGMIEWQQTLGTPYTDVAHDVTETSDGGYFFVGESYPSGGYDKDLWAVKLSAEGEVQWEETFAGSGIERALSVQQTRDGGYVLTGHTRSKDGDAATRPDSSTTSAWVIKLGPVSHGPSAWAAAEIAMARQYGLVTERVLRNYQQAITRAEFSELAVLLYEALSGQAAARVWPSPFTDTYNLEVLKAYGLGIVAGVGEGLFAPQNPITREQIAVMFYRTLTAALPDLEPPAAAAPAFTDGAQVAPWARAAVDDLSARGIIGGMGDGRFAPQGTATREQAIALVRRVYAAFMPGEGDDS